MLSIVDAKAICRNFTRRDKEIGIENPRREDNLSKKVAGWDANSTWCGGYWGSKGFACSSRPWAPKREKGASKKVAWCQRGLGDANQYGECFACKVYDNKLQTTRCEEDISYNKTSM